MEAVTTELPRRRRALCQDVPLTPAQIELRQKMEAELARRKAERQIGQDSAGLHVTSQVPSRSSSSAKPRVRSPRNRVLKGMTVSALAIAGVTVPVLGNFGGGAQASQPMNASILGGQTEQAQTPESLAGTPTAAIKSVAYTAEEQAKANPVVATCEPTNVQGIRAAFVQNRESLVVFPVPAGTFQRTSGFGPRSDPFSGASSYHAGQDYAAPNDTPIHAIADGVVLVAGGSHAGRSENTVVIRHQIGGKVYESWYVHMYDHGVLVKAGDTVTAGQKIGLVGSNGNSTGPHLHFEIHDPSLGAADDIAALLNPDEFLAGHKAVDISEMCG
ncbi:MAG: M23 family metallopeptidase [Ancrocorticia sp.]